MVERIDPSWISAFVEVFSLCKIRAEETVVILSETGSRQINVRLAELALGQMNLPYFCITVPSPRVPAGPIIRSSGACMALTGQPVAVKTLAEADVIIDLTVEGLMHARETAAILKGGARIMNVSNEAPDALTRLVPKPELKEQAKEAVARCRVASVMTIKSHAGTDFTVQMAGAATVGVWGWTDRPGTLAHWPGGIIVSFPKAGSAAGRLAYRAGDMNLTFKRYFDGNVDMTFEDDYLIRIEGTGTDAKLMRDYYASFDEKEAYAVSHVGWGFNRDARYEALTMYDKADTNGTELRAVAGNFLFSTGANEFAGRFTRGHFDLPMMGCDIALDGVMVVEGGRLL